MICIGATPECGILGCRIRIVTRRPSWLHPFRLATPLSLRHSRRIRTRTSSRRTKMPTHPISFGIQTGQQNCTWEQVRDIWQKADVWGYDSIWAFDHFYPIFVPDPSGPCMESWTLLGALSQVTKRARIGALVNGN